MEDFANILQRDYGLKPQGKAAPMAATKSGPVLGNTVKGKGGSGRLVGRNAASGLDEDIIFSGGSNAGKVSMSGGFEDPLFPSAYDDVFGGPPKYASSSQYPFVSPVYDEDIFGGVPGTRSSGGEAVYADVFGGTPVTADTPAYPDLLGGYGAGDSKLRASSSAPGNSFKGSSVWPAADFVVGETGDDDLIPGFTSDLPRARSVGDVKPSQQHDPFNIIGSNRASSVSPASFSPMDPSIPSNVPSRGRPLSQMPVSGPTVKEGIHLFDNSEPSLPLNSSSKSLPTSKDVPTKKYDPIPSVAPASKESSQMDERTSLQRNIPIVNLVDGSAPDVKSSHDFEKPGGQSVLESRSLSPKDTRHVNDTVKINDFKLDQESHKLEKTFKLAPDGWLMVEDLKLLTQPCDLPPPERAPPRPNLAEKSQYLQPDNQHYPSWKDISEFASDLPAKQQQVPSFFKPGLHTTYDSVETTNLFEGVEGYVPPVLQSEVNECSNGEPGVPVNESMDSTGVRIKFPRDSDREKIDTEESSNFSEQKPVDSLKELKNSDWRGGRSKDRTRQKDGEISRERQKEREKDRAAVERAMQEARERAAQEAKERAAVDRATAEARERAVAEAKEKASAERAEAELRSRTERAAVERAKAEARERAAEKAAAEHAALEERNRADKAAAERSAAEARERAEKIALERAAAAAREKDQQQRQTGDVDLESFFNMASSRATSEPRQRPANGGAQGNYGKNSRRPSAGSSSTNKVISKAPADDWTSVFKTSPGDKFQEIEGELPERRKARFERHQRTLERTARALAEKNQRDIESQREQAEKSRAADVLDAEIRRWAAGKEGNLRALLSTLQYVLWPECGWQAVSLSDLIGSAAVKKTYKKAALCVHPDKVQQKGASVQQKYIAEKVFDLLQEAWKKFNSEELF